MVGPLVEELQELYLRRSCVEWETPIAMANPHRLEKSADGVHH